MFCSLLRACEIGNGEAVESDGDVENLELDDAAGCLCFDDITHFVTQEGYDSLVAQLRRMEQIDRPAASAAIAEARDKGDLCFAQTHYTHSRITIYLN